MAEPIWIGSEALQEQADSPHWEFSDKSKVTVRYRGPYTLCLSSAPRRGDFATGDYAGLLVSSAEVTKEKGGIGTLVIVYEGTLSGDDKVPKDEIEIEMAQKEFSMEIHPLFEGLAEDLKNAVKSYINASTDEDRMAANGKIETSPAAIKLRDRMLRGQTHFVLFPPVYTWTLYSIAEPWADVGGYIEDPFGSVTAPIGYSWLRCADQLSWNGTYWKLERRWIASYEWDEEIYPVYQ